MKLSQIYLLVAACFVVFSCRETLGEQHRNSKEQRTAPSPKKQEPATKVPEVPSPNKEKQPIQKPGTEKKARKRDTLKPIRAIP